MGPKRSDRRWGFRGGRTKRIDTSWRGTLRQGPQHLRTQKKKKTTPNYPTHQKINHNQRPNNPPQPNPPPPQPPTNYSQPQESKKPPTLLKIIEKVIRDIQEEWIILCWKLENPKPRTSYCGLKGGRGGGTVCPA